MSCAYHTHTDVHVCIQRQYNVVCIPVCMRLVSSSKIFLERSLMDVTERKILFSSLSLKHLALELEFSSRNITDICAFTRFTYC